VYTDQSVDTTWSSARSSFSPSPVSSRALSSVTSQVPSGGGKPAAVEGVQVTVSRATGLFGSSCKDLFVAMKLGEERRVTSACAAMETAAKGGSIVTWDQSFFMSCASLRSSSLRVRLYGKKIMGRKVVLGEAHVHLLGLIEADNHILEGAWPLTGVVGQVELRLVFEVDHKDMGLPPPLDLNQPGDAR